MRRWRKLRNCSAVVPETPDFDQIARNMITPIEGDDDERRQLKAKVVADIAEQLRLVWNARGAADIALLEATVVELFERPSPSMAKTLDRALRTLDR